MNRRNFIRNSSAVGLSTTALGTAAYTLDKQGPSENGPAAFADNFVLNETTIGDLQKKMQSGQYTSVNLTKLYLDRIQAIDKKGPALH